jgi:hypothetical protein
MEDNYMPVLMILKSQFEGAGYQKRDQHTRLDKEPCLQPLAESRPWSPDQINAGLNGLQLPHGANEPLIESLLQRIENCDSRSQAQYRLLTARVLEAALVCTGHYVDNCEFGAAGDLFVNPRRILIHIRGYRHPVVKIRHGRLSEQLAPYCRNRPFPTWFKHNAALEIVKPALVPDLLQRLKRSQSFRPAYLDSIHRRMNKVADAIGFLSAWGIAGWEDKHRRIQSTSPQMRGFIAEHLCKFDLENFHALGQEIDRMADMQGIRSRYLKY